MFNNFIVTWGIEISILVRILSCVIILFFFLPLQVKEARVQNGLRKLRYQLLAEGLILFLTNVLSLYFLFDIFINNTPQKFINSGLQILNAFAFLTMSIIAFLIYKQQYTEQSREAHKKLAEIEEKLTHSDNQP